MSSDRPSSMGSMLLNWSMGESFDHPWFDVHRKAQSKTNLAKINVGKISNQKTIKQNSLLLEISGLPVQKWANFLGFQDIVR